MSYKIAIASGKGGTGKTTVSVNLYKKFSETLKDKVILVDCDVEEPNDRIFFEEALLLEKTNAFQMIPHIDSKKCTFCKKCVEYCEFNAISIISKVKHTAVDASLCHSCGACLIACQFDAITEHPKNIGEIRSFATPFGIGLIEGKLKVGSAMQTPMIAKTKESSPNAVKLTLYDAPPGTSCPVVETVADADYVVLVIEPTPFGLHDVRLMVELLQEMKIAFGIVVNKADLGNKTLYQYIQSNHLELLGKIPFNKSYAASYSNGDLFTNIPDSIQNEYRLIVQKLMDKIELA